jgi:regulator of protease activity HflC (stomatin/prohibitin superfamily)
MLNLVGFALILLGVGLLFTPRRRLAPPLLGLRGLLLLLANSFVVVLAGHVGVVFNILKGVQDRPLYEGVHFVVPGLQQVVLYDARVKEVTFSAPTRERGGRTPPSGPAPRRAWRSGWT